MGAIERAKDIKSILMGAAAVVGALVIAALGVFDVVALRIGSLALGSWAMYVVAVVVLVVGVLVMLMASDQPRCVRCKAFLECREAYFPLEALEVVKQAVGTGDPSALVAVPAVPKNQMKSVASVQYCPTCREVGQVSAEKWQDSQHSDVLPLREVLGPPMRAFADMVDRHHEGRGEDDD